MRKHALKKLMSPRFMCSEILDVHRQIDRMIRDTPRAAFRTYWVKTGRGMKPLTAVDLMAEKSFEGSLNHICGSDNILVVGEESLDAADLTEERRLCVLVDMIDGTDLLQRGFANWCSAIVIFDPESAPPRILASYVAVKGEALYYANAQGAYRWPLRRRATRGPSRLFVPHSDISMKDATLCMYAQKNSRLLALLDLNDTGLSAWLKERTADDRALKGKLHRGEQEVESSFRFYDLAGNPMMCRLLTGNVHLVVDLNGQSPHDVVPGAYVAIKGGADLRTPQGDRITEMELAMALLRPGLSDIKYILAANDELAMEFARIVSRDGLRS